MTSWASNAALTAAAFWLLAGSAAHLAAHPSLSLHIEHRCGMIIDAANIEVRLDLVFYHPRSQGERTAMDVNRDGTISDREMNAYLERVQEAVEEKLKLTVDGRALRLLLLFEPRLELASRRADAKEGFTLRLTLFARTPAWLRGGSEIALHDGLWAEEPGIHRLVAEGRDRVRAVALSDSSPLHPGRRGGAARVSRVRCLSISERAQPASQKPAVGLTAVSLGSKP